MCLIHRKKDSLKTSEDGELIDHNYKSIDSILALVNNNETIKKELTEIREKLRFLIPSPKSEIYKFDKKIQDEIGEMRIACVKEKDSEKITEYMAQIKLLIADRNAKI